MEELFIQEESLNLSHKVELISGVATGILAICAPAVLSLGYSGFGPYIVLALIVTIGSYLHVVRRKLVGFVVVMLAGGIFSVLGIVGTAIVLVYAVTNRSMVLVYLPGVTAFITVLAAIVTQLRRRRAVV